MVLTYLSTGLENRKALWTSLTVAMIGIGLYMPLQNLFWYVEMSWLWMILLLRRLAIRNRDCAVGLSFRGRDPWVSARTGGARRGRHELLRLRRSDVPGVGRVLISIPAINGRPIATIGAQTPNLAGDFWLTNQQYVGPLLANRFRLRIARLIVDGLPLHFLRYRQLAVACFFRM